MKDTKIIFFIFIFFCCFLIAKPSENSEKKEPSKIKTRGIIEYGIDSSERKFLKPSIRFDIPFSLATAFAEITYYQRANSKIQGIVDYWIKSGLKKSINKKTEIEASINHMCRHMTLRDNPYIFDLNELIAGINFRLNEIHLGFGAGKYLGGSIKYSSLFTFKFSLPDILNNNISLDSEFKLVELKKILHEVVVSFSLDKSTELFFRNAKHYELPVMSYIGIRTRTNTRIDKHLDSLKFSAGFYPFYDYHKILVESEYRFNFFKKPKRRLILSFKMNAPILRGKGFWDTFYPDEMTYPISMEYEIKLTKNLFLSWFNHYNLRLPLDVEENYSSDLATGVLMRNQPDFEQNRKNIKFEIYAGYNFKLDYDLGLKFGVKLLDDKIFNLFSDFNFNIDKKQANYSFRIYSDLGKDISIRPFLRFDKKTFLSSEKYSDMHFLYGISLLKWFN